MASGDINNYLEETELLIQLVRERPALYDRSRSDFKDPAYKQFMWQEVGDLMGSTTQEIHKRWISLRDRYTAEHRKLKKHPNAAPSGWHFYESMTFLEKQIIERRRILPYIYGSVKCVEPVKEAGSVKIEAFDSGVSGDSPWDGAVVNSVTTETGYGDNAGIDEAVTPEIEEPISCRKRRRSRSPSFPTIPVTKDTSKLEEGIVESLRDIGNATRQLAVGKTDVENADKLFGKMIGVMISEMNDDDKDRAKIHIMSYLCTHGYKSNESN